MAPPPLRSAGRALVTAERAMIDGTDDGDVYQLPNFDVAMAALAAPARLAEVRLAKRLS